MAISPSSSLNPRNYFEPCPNKVWKPSVGENVEDIYVLIVPASLVLLKDIKDRNPA
jgi:hypothetical protein